MSSRSASHAGSWYPASRTALINQLDGFILPVPTESRSISGARIIISPHAGYSYSGATAAFGFKAIDWTEIKRVFILGPHHHLSSHRCHTSKCTSYATPLGPLEIDQECISELQKTGSFESMSLSVDEKEHSIEMQLPYLAHVMPTEHRPKLVPILVGSLDADSEEVYGAILRPYVLDASNVFVISSDFCHWGARFSYTRYHAPSSPAVRRVNRSQITIPIYESIKALDEEGMESIKNVSHKDFRSYLTTTRNTICGRHPILVILVALQGSIGSFKFLKYAQSNQVRDVDDESVSYASAYYDER